MSLASCQTAPPRDSERLLLSGARWVVNLSASAGDAIERGARGAGWEDDAEGGALARDAFDLEAAAVRGDDAVGDRETEPGPAAHVLGREEWLEDPSQPLGRDAGTGVADRDACLRGAPAPAPP